MPFVKGQSGNPAGRPLGSRNKSTLAFEALAELEGPKLIEALFIKAKQGHAWAIRLLLVRMVAVRREPAPFALPAITAEKSWRRLDGHNQLPKVILGVKFTDGIEVVR